MTCYQPECRVPKPCRICSSMWFPKEEDVYLRAHGNSWSFGD